MALVSTVYPPEIWAMESLMVLRDQLVMARLVHRDFENEVAARGDVVHTRKPSKLTARTWAGQTGTDANEQMTIENLNARNLSITLDTLVYTAFLVEDRDAALSIKELQNEFLIPAMDPIAQKIDDDIMTEFCSASSSDITGSAMTTVAYDTVGLEAAMNVDDIIAARERLNTNQCPLDSRRLVVSADHEADLLRLALFTQADQSGSTDALVNANLGRKFGFDIYMTQNVPNAVDTDATPQSLAFHPNALAFVNRPLNQVNGYGAQSAYKTIDNLSLRVVSCYDPRYKGVCVSFDTLYGTQLLDSKLGVIINP